MIIQSGSANVDPANEGGMVWVRLLGGLVHVDRGGSSLVGSIENGGRRYTKLPGFEARLAVNEGWGVIESPPSGDNTLDVSANAGFTEA